MVGNTARCFSSLCLRIAGPSILCIRRISFEDHWTEPWILDAVFVLLHVLRDVCIEALGDPRHDFNYLLRRVAWQSLRMECGEEVCCDKTLEFGNSACAPTA